MNALESRLAAAVLLLAAPTASAALQKLYLVEVVVAPTQAEYVAIYDPSDTAVDLSDYYLADSETYYQVVAGVGPALTSDFVARFPPGARIRPGETQYVSVAGAQCFHDACGTQGPFTGFGVDPTYELAHGNVATESASVPDMVEPFAGALGSGATLTNGGEPIVLFYWDGVTPLVTDVDYVYYGTSSVSNPVVDKTGVSILNASYLPDTPQASQQFAPLSTSGVTDNTCRSTPYNEGTQATAGGNGIGGSDETSEPSATTWFACAEVHPVPEPSGSIGAAAACAALAALFRARARGLIPIVASSGDTAPVRTRETVEVRANEEPTMGNRTRRFRGAPLVALLALAPRLAGASSAPAPFVYVTGLAQASTAMTVQQTFNQFSATGPVSGSAFDADGASGQAHSTRGSAIGLVDYGRIGVSSFGEATGPATVADQDQILGSGDAVAEFKDSFTITAQDPALSGQPGTLTFSVPLSETVSVDDGGSGNGLIAVVYRMEVDAGDCGDACTFIRQGTWHTGQFDGDPATGLSMVSVPFRFSVPLILDVTLDVEAQAVMGIDPLDAKASGEFRHSLTWGGFDEVQDGQGNAVTSYTVASDSGFDYALPAAEPAAEPAFAVATLLGVAARRRRAST